MNFVENKIKSFTWLLLLVFLIIGWVYPLIGMAALVCMMAPVIVGIIKGNKKWCSMFCPRGVFNDVILSRISRKVKHPRILNKDYFKTGFLLFIMFNFISGILKAWPDPILMGLVFVRMVSITTAITIIVGVVFHHRTWCAFCPMGYLAAVAIKIRKKKLKRIKPVDVLD